ncbi:YhdB family protein [Halobacillus sp. A1]|uniref:YhdB family protein n=1 Tax=Halobacillus campisalis TaxID=435909 RepID=A0ABW2K0H2_9BACI|nr:MULTISPECIES: YhdB family protein [Halobacillus]MCP3032429.1 YhdB family protein [Halobacillus sp. A1]
MYQDDYEKALNFMIWGQWDDLLVLMVRTNDHFLAKKIESFLHAYHYPDSEASLYVTHENLLHYIDHAQAATQPTLYV